MRRRAKAPTHSLAFQIGMALALSLGWTAALARPTHAQTVDCSALDELMTYNFHVASDPTCASDFGDLQKYLFVSDNFCRMRDHESPITCTLADGVSQKTLNDLAAITSKAAMNPGIAHRLILERYANLDDRPIINCLTTPDGQAADARHFQELLLNALPEITVPPPKASKNQRHTRSDVPFKFLSNGDKELISAVVGAFLWRARGGWLPLHNTQLARLLYVGVGYSALGYFNGGKDGAIAGALLMPPLFVNGWASNMDIGHSAGTEWGDALAMTGRGLLQTSLSGAFQLYEGYGALGLGSGAAMGPCYVAAWTASDAFNLNYSQNRAAILNSPTAVGELCTGASLGLGLSANMLNGTTNPNNK